VTDPLDPFREAVALHGLQLVGAVDVARARSLHVPAVGGADPLGDATRTVLVVASGGRTFWERLPPDLRGQEHPIDEAGARAIRDALGRLPGAARVLVPPDTDRFDLRRLAEAAGLGVVSPHLQLLLHPVHGPWVSVRGLVALDVVVPSSAPLAWDPCGPCARPCLDACPVGAYGRTAPFDVGRCADHRLREESPPRHCASRCHARDACVVGPEHRYGDVEMRHRHRAGLPMLRDWRRSSGGPNVNT
jgi:epoxyqueuosine reductase